jgi:hypothetical protein
MEKQAAHRVCKKGKPAIVVAGHKNTKKQINKMPGAMGLKTVKTFLSSFYNPTKARQR